MYWEDGYAIFVVCVAREAARSVHVNGITYIWSLSQKFLPQKIKGRNNPTREQSYPKGSRKKRPGYLEHVRRVGRADLYVKIGIHATGQPGNLKQNVGAAE